MAETDVTRKSPRKKSGGSTYTKRPSLKVLREVIHNQAGIVTNVAKALGVSRITVIRWKKKPKIAALFDEAREATLDLAEGKLVEAIKDKAGWAVCFYLKCQGKDRGWNEKMEVSGSLTHDLEVKDGVNLARELLADAAAREAVNQLLESLSAREAGAAGADESGGAGMVRH